MKPQVGARLGLRGVLLLAVVALVASCSVSNPFGAGSMGPPLTVLARDAVDAYAQAPSVQVRGSYDVGSTQVTVRVAAQPAPTGSISGQGTYGGLPLTVAGQGAQMFTKGVKYWQMRGAGDLRIWPAYGQGWVRAPSNDPGAAAIGAARDLGGLVDQLGEQASAMVSVGTSELDGQEIASLRDGRTTYEITTSRPYRLLGVQRSGRTATPAGLSELNLQVHYGGALKVSLPPAGQYVDPRDAATFPALFETQSTSDIQSCDQNSCGFTATLLNTAGAEQGQVTATLGLYQDPQFTQLIGSCQVAVPNVGNGQTTSVTCRITDQSYQSFYAALTTGTSVYRHVTIDNPPYGTS